MRPRVETFLSTELARHAAHMQTAAASQQHLDEVQQAILDQFGSGLTAHGFQRTRGWPQSNLLGLTAWFRRTRPLAKEVERFLAAARAEGVKV